MCLLGIKEEDFLPLALGPPAVAGPPEGAVAASDKINLKASNGGVAAKNWSLR